MDFLFELKLRLEECENNDGRENECLSEVEGLLVSDKNWDSFGLNAERESLERSSMLCGCMFLVKRNFLFKRRQDRLLRRCADVRLEQTRVLLVIFHNSSNAWSERVLSYWKEISIDSMSGA